MCTLIVTIRTVLWYMVSLAGTLMILVSMSSNRWLEGRVSVTNLADADTIVDTFSKTVQDVADGDFGQIAEPSVGLFLNCKVPSGKKFFDGECIPDLNNVETLFTDLDDRRYPHAWRGAVLCFVLGLALLLLTDFFALMTLCCRRCLCCSVFTVCGSIQSFAAILFTLGMLAYPVGWGSEIVNREYCAGQSAPFVLGDACSIGIAFWVALAGTICTYISSSLAIWAYQSTKTVRCQHQQADGDRCICLP